MGKMGFEESLLTRAEGTGTNIEGEGEIVGRVIRMVGLGREGVEAGG